ncbi:MAG: hypothetical protein ACYTEG_07575 [Planctomycetota bacterium]|jgi:hypothetical protein
MSAAESKLRAALAAPGLALALFQCWYAYLPDGEAVAFHQCRINAQLDCYKSLSLHGAEMRPFGVPVLASLAALYLAITLLLAGAALATEPRTSSWRTWASLLSFPAAGLSVYVLLHDWQVAKASSLSTLLILGIGLSLCVLTILRGVAVNTLKAGAAGFAGWMAIALVAGFLLHGTGSAQLVAREIEIEREGEPAQLRWARFAHSIPRVGAAHLGNPTAPREILLFVNPALPESQAIMRAAAKLAPRLGDAVVIYLYAPSDYRLLSAHERGRLAAYLEDPSSLPEMKLTPSKEFQRQVEAIEKLGLRYPSAWTRDGKREGDIDVAALVTSLRAR